MVPGSSSVCRLVDLEALKKLAKCTKIDLASNLECILKALKCYKLILGTFLSLIFVNWVFSFFYFNWINKEKD